MVGSLREWGTAAIQQGAIHDPKTLKLLSFLNEARTKLRTLGRPLHA